MLTIREILEYMHSGAQFSLEAVTFDKKRPLKCGDVVVVECGVLMWAELDASRPRRRGERPMTPLERQAAAIGLPDARKPRHQENYTRNVRLFANGLPTETIVKIHPPLIIKFNGQDTAP